MNAVRSARLPRFIHEFSSIPNATDLGFSFTPLVSTLMQRGFRHQRGSMPADATIVSLRSDTAEAPAARRDCPREQPERRPREQPEQPIERSSEPEKAPQSPRRRWVRWVSFALLPLALIASAYWYVTGGQVMSTDDAYVEADKVGISTDVSGIVKEIGIGDNQHVTSGQILYRLHPRQFHIALDNAKANLAQTALTIEAMKRDYKRMLSDIAAQQA